MKNKRTIRVTGKGKLTVIPDRTILLMALSGVEKMYKSALDQSKETSRIIKEVFLKLGFQNSDIKTHTFEIETKHEREYDEKNCWKTTFAGYEYTHIMCVEFDKNNELLGKIIYELSQSSVTPELSLQYTVKDIEKKKSELLSKAVFDSRKKAEILAEAARVKLGSIEHIDYSWGEMKLVSSVVENFIDCMKLSDDVYEEDYFDMDIEPEDINVSDTVTIVWEIE